MVVLKENQERLQRSWLDFGITKNVVQVLTHPNR